MRGFGPPHGFTRASTCPWIDHSVSGLPHHTRRPVQTRFRYAYATEWLKLAWYDKSLGHYAKGTPTTWTNHRSSTACKYMVSETISLPARGAFQCSLTLLSTIGLSGVFSLGGWSPHVHARFHETGATQEFPRAHLSVVYRPVTLYWAAFQLLLLDL